MSGSNFLGQLGSLLIKNIMIINNELMKRCQLYTLQMIMICVICLMLPIKPMAQEIPTMEENDFKWKIPGAKYADPTSFFSLHGYVDGVFGSTSKEWTAPRKVGIGMPGQVIVPNTNNSSFSYDAAIFIGSEMSHNTRVIMEMHLVTDPSGTGKAGPGGLTFVLTEGTGSWDIHKELLTLSAGIFWLPFGTVNQDWLGAQNLFSLLPQASEAMPTHWNERGVRVNGMKKIGEKSAVNYVFSVGNGYESWSIMGQRSVDNNENKSATGRVSLYPGLEDKLNIGFSYSMGDLGGLDTTMKSLELMRYPSDFNAYGADLIASINNLSVRSYFIASQQILDISSNNMQSETAKISRTGWMAELQYKLDISKLDIGLESINPKIRYDFLAADVLEGADGETKNYQNTTLSYGVNLYVNSQFYIALDYNICNEVNYDELDNDRFIARLTARF